MKCNKSSLFPIIVKVTLLVVSIFAIVILTWFRPPSKLDCILLAAGISIALLVLFLFTFMEKQVDVPVLVPRDPEGQAPKDSVSVPEKPNEPEIPAEKPVHAIDQAVVPSQVDELRSMREHYCTPFNSILSAMDEEQMTEEQRKQVISDLCQIALLFMDYTELVTRPSSRDGAEWLKHLLDGQIDTMKSIAKPVTEHPIETPKYFRVLRKALSSDEDCFVYSGYKF